MPMWFSESAHRTSVARNSLLLKEYVDASLDCEVHASWLTSLLTNQLGRSSSLPMGADRNRRMASLLPQGIYLPVLEWASSL